MNLNFSDFIVLNCLNSNQNLTFLVDTQADSSIIKCECINFNTEINENDIINIRGVTEGKISSFGSIFLQFNLSEFSIKHKFHIVPNEFNIPSSGIIGRDFIKQYKCKINYEYMNISFKIDKNRVNIPIQNGPENELIAIPPRCEVIRKFQIKNKLEPQIVEKLQMEFT